jgi:phosphopantetheinyl transferase
LNNKNLKSKALIYYTANKDIELIPFAFKNKDLLEKSLFLKTHRTKNKKAFNLRLLGRALLLRGILDLGYSCDELKKLQFGPNGKPFFSDIGIQFNIAHCDTMVVCAFSELEIGIDVEGKSDQEQKLLSNALIALKINNLNASLSDWTKIEAVIKLMGNSLVSTMKSPFSFYSDKFTVNGKKVTLTEVLLGYGHSCYLASYLSPFSYTLKNVF